MKVIVSGGGTGGHIYPALAIAKGLQEAEAGTEVLYVGTAKGLEAGIVPQTGVPFRTVTVEGLPRKIGVRLFSSLLKVTKGFFQAMQIMDEFRPDIVIGTGGYVCGPVVLAAVLKKIPTLIHEQNAFPGITNKLLARLVNRVATTFPESVKYFKNPGKVVVTGLPVRPEILNARPEDGTNLGFAPDRFNVLVVGGSRGARSINLAMVEVLEHFHNHAGVRLLLVTGESGYHELNDRLKLRGLDPAKLNNIIIRPYLHNMPAALAAANLIVCRAGATTIAEITAKGIPSILIPYPYAAENHQEYNARALVDKGAAVMIKDAELTGRKIIENVELLRQDIQLWHKMAEKSKALGRPDALQNIVKLAQNLLK